MSSCRRRCHVVVVVVVSSYRRVVIETIVSLLNLHKVVSIRKYLQITHENIAQSGKGIVCRGRGFKIYLHNTHGNSAHSGKGIVCRGRGFGTEKMEKNIL